MSPPSHGLMDRPSSGSWRSGTVCRVGIWPPAIRRAGRHKHIVIEAQVYLAGNPSDTHPKMEALQIQFWQQACWHLQVCARDTHRQAKPSCAADWQACYWERSWQAKYMESWKMQNEPIE